MAYGREIAPKVMIELLVKNHGVTWAGWYRPGNLKREWGARVQTPVSQFPPDAWTRARAADRKGWGK